MQRRTSPTGRRSPYPEIVDGYALPLEGPGLGIEANVPLVDEASDDEELAASKPFVPSLQPRLNALDGSVRDFRVSSSTHKMLPSRAGTSIILSSLNVCLSRPDK
jgi:hypothetical protein